MRSRMKKDRRSLLLLEQVEAIAKLFDYSIEPKVPSTPSDIAKEHRNRIRKGQGGNLIQIYLAWLWCYHRSEAQELYGKLRLPFREFTAEPPLPRETELKALSEALPQNFNGIAALRDFFSETLAEAIYGVIQTKTFRRGLIAVSAFISLFVAASLSTTFFATRSGLKQVERMFDEHFEGWPLEGISEYPLKTQVTILEQEARKEEHSSLRMASLASSLGILRLTTRSAEAIPDLKKAFELSPNNSIFGMRLALAEAASGDMSSAYQTLKLAAQTGNEEHHDDIAEMRRILWVFNTVPPTNAPTNDPEAKRKTWNGLVSIEDQAIKDTILVRTALAHVVWFDDDDYYDSLMQYTDECTRHIMRTVLSSCRLAIARKLDEAGRGEEAVRVFRDVAKESYQDGQIEIAAYANSALGVLLAESLDRPDEGLATALRAVEQARESADPATIFDALGNLASIQNRALQDPTSALASTREAYAVATENLSLRVLPLNFLYFYASLENESGEPGRAIEIFERHAPSLGERSPEEIWTKAHWLLNYSRVLSKIGKLEEASLQYEKSSELMEMYAGALASSEDIGGDTPPWRTSKFRKRLYAVLELSVEGYYGVVDEILLNALEEIAALPPDLEALYRPYSAALRLQRMDNLLDAHEEGVLTFVSKKESELLLKLRNEIQTLREIQRDYEKSGRPNVPDGLRRYAVTTREIDELELRAESLIGDKAVADRLFLSMWTERLIVVLRAAKIDIGEGAGEITFSLAPKDRERLRPIYKAAISQEIDWISVPGFRGWLQFLSGHVEHVIRMRSTDAVLISAFFPKRAADKKLLFGVTPHYLLSGIYLEAEVLRRADLGDEVAERAAGFVFPDMLQLQIDYVDWIDGTKGTNRQVGSDVHLAALRPAMTASRYLGDISKTLELVDEYEAVYIERGDTCSKCDSWRLNIADADFYAGG